MTSIKKTIFLIGILIIANACGYHFQGANNPLRGIGIEKIYVKSFSNKTNRPGIEQLFTTAMVREIRRSRIFKLVNSPYEADATLEGVVTDASTSPGGTVAARLPDTPADPTAATAQIAAQYSSSVSCSVALRDRDGLAIFSKDVSSGKTHPGLAPTKIDSTNQAYFDAEQIATVPLTNESEQRISYQQMAIHMMADVYQRMIDVF